MKLEYDTRFNIWDDVLIIIGWNLLWWKIESIKWELYRNSHWELWTNNKIIYWVDTWWGEIYWMKDDEVIWLEDPK